MITQSTLSRNFAWSVVSNSIWLYDSLQRAQVPCKGQAPLSPKHPPLDYTLAEPQEVLQRIAEMLDSEEAIRISLPKNVTNAKLRHQVMPVTQARLWNQTHDITETRQLISAAVEDKSHCSGTLSIPAHHHHQPLPRRRPQAQHWGEKPIGSHAQSKQWGGASQKN